MGRSLKICGTIHWKRYAKKTCCRQSSHSPALWHHDKMSNTQVVTVQFCGTLTKWATGHSPALWHHDKMSNTQVVTVQLCGTMTKWAAHKWSQSSFVAPGQNEQHTSGHSPALWHHDIMSNTQVVTVQFYGTMTKWAIRNKIATTRFLINWKEKLCKNVRKRTQI